MKICTVEGCERKQKARTWCTIHWGRWRRHGDPTAGDAMRNTGQFTTPFEVRSTPGEGGCLIWTGANKSGGYGSLSVNGVRMLAHRYAWERANGPIPDGAVIDHICGVTLCVNPDHLRIATVKQNAENLTRLYSTNTSGYRNVSRAGDGRWRVVVKSFGRAYYGGTYRNIEEADSAAVELRNKLFTHNVRDRAS